MSVASHLDSLKRKHIALEEQIADISASPMPDDTKVKTLKLQKLRLKEQIEKIRLSQETETRH